MRGLKIIVLTDDAERFRGALGIAAAHAALGGEAALFLQLDAVRLLGTPTAPKDDIHQAEGLPTLAALLEHALVLGVKITVCQSGMALARIEAGALDARIEAGGPVQFLGDCRDDDRLLMI